MFWVTCRQVRLDRAACVWLIRRHIDPAAEIAYVDGAEVAAAVATGALPFHVTIQEDELASAAVTEERTSFVSLAVEYNLVPRDAALELVRAIVRAAEIPAGDDPPEAAGLRAIAQGLRAQIGDDAAMAQAMLPVFDALYTYCQRQVRGDPLWATQDPAPARGTRTGRGRASTQGKRNANPL